jgi:hypothetical protein
MLLCVMDLSNDRLRNIYHARPTKSVLHACDSVRITRTDYSGSVHVGY